MTSSRGKRKSYLLGTSRHLRKGVVLNKPVVILGRAVLGLGLLGVTAVTRGGGVLGEGLLVGVELGQLDALAGLVGDVLALGDVDDSVSVLLHGVLVHETAGVDGGHLLLVHEGADLAKVAAVGGAAVLGQEDRQAIVGKVLDLDVPARGLEVALAPRVVVKGEEVGALLVGAAVEVLGRLHAVLGHVGGRVADGDGAVLARLDVGPHVAVGGLDIRSRERALGLIVDDLVSGEEGKGVVVLGELVDGGEDALQVDGVVGGVGGLAVDGVQRVVDVEGDVDAGVRESLHALLVRLGVVGRVDTDNVDAEILEPLDILKADLGVGKGVLGDCVSRPVIMYF